MISENYYNILAPIFVAEANIAFLQMSFKYTFDERKLILFQNIKYNRQAKVKKHIFGLGSIVNSLISAAQHIICSLAIASRPFG